MKIINGGKVSYDFNTDHITIENFHFDGEGVQPTVEDMLKCLINAMRRKLYEINNNKAKIKIYNPIKPEAADIKPVGWWAND